jgi:transposase
MCLKTSFPQEIPAETRRVVDPLLKTGNLYRLVGQEAEQLVDEASLAQLYDEEGRPGVNPVILALVTVFQYVEKLPDRQAADMSALRLDWKYALRQELDWAGFHYSDLCNFRKRLLREGQSQVVFEGVVSYLRARGYLKTRGKQRTDATHVLGNVMRLSRLELVWETLRLAVSALVSADAPWTLRWLPASYVESYSQRRMDYRLSTEEVQQQLHQAGQEGYWLLDQVAAHGEEALRQLPEITLLRRVLDEQFERQDDGRSHARPESDCTGDVISNPHDPEVRYGSKGRIEWRGYKLQVTETAEETQPVQFITDVAVTSTLETDHRSLAAIQDRLAHRDLAPARQYVDQGYTSGATIEASQRRGIDLRGFVPGDTRKPVGFRLGDFTLDLAAHTATCPAGRSARSFKPVTSGAADVAYRVSFGSFCRDCPGFGRCTTNRQGRTLDLSPYHATIQARRQLAHDPAFHREMHRRSAIEGTLSELVRAQGARRARYRGRSKTLLQACFTAAATNLKRLARTLLVAGGSEPLTKPYLLLVSS